MNSLIKTEVPAVAELDRQIEQALRWAINATTDDELKAAQTLLNDLKIQRNAELYPIVTELGLDGKQKIAVPLALCQKIFLHTEDMAIFVKRALAFRAAFIKD